MKQKYFMLGVLASLAATSAIAETQTSDDALNFAQTQTTPASSQPSKNIESTNAGGEKEMTIIDESGNLKIVEHPSKQITTTTTTTTSKKQQPPTSSTPMTSPGMMQAAPTVSGPKSLQPTEGQHVSRPNPQPGTNLEHPGAATPPGMMNQPPMQSQPMGAPNQPVMAPNKAAPVPNQATEPTPPQTPSTQPNTVNGELNQPSTQPTQ